jgi:CRP-like cAMP-binding protein
MKQLLDEILSSPRLMEGVAWKRVRYKAGERIIEKGEVGHAFFLIEDGGVRVFGGTGAGEDLLETQGLCDLSKDEVFGDICLYGTRHRSASVVAISDVRLVEIRNDMLSVYLDDHPVEGYLFLKVLSEVMISRLVAANERIENLMRSKYSTG